MSILYIDCRNGISGDMVRRALENLGADLDHLHIHSNHQHHGHDHGHDHGHSHSHGRSFQDVKALINAQSVSDKVKERAVNIYEVIAKAEAKVHEETVETVHFHEVGRDEAILNILSVSLALEQLGIEKVYCSPVHDGKGFVECSHGRIPVPVPAVMAMRETCDFIFVRDEVETEMVTPSGLAMLIGIGATCIQEPPTSKLLKSAVGKGSRDTGREGLVISLFDSAE